MGRTNFTRLFAVAAALVALVALTASALAQPNPQHRFYGSGVTIDGEEAPAGTSISAWVDGEVVGSAATAADGTWYIDVDGGNTVAFSVGDLVAEGTHDSVVGGQSNVSLAVTTPPPPPEPEPECPEEGMMDDGMMGDDAMMDDGDESMMDDGEASDDSMMGDDESMMDDSMMDDCPPVEMDDCPEDGMMDDGSMDDGAMEDDSLEGDDSMMDDGAMDEGMTEDCPEDAEAMPGEGEGEMEHEPADEGEVTAPTGGSGGLAHEGGLSAGLVALITILAVAAAGGAGLTAIRLRNRA